MLIVSKRGTQHAVESGRRLGRHATANRLTHRLVSGLESHSVRKRSSSTVAGGCVQTVRWMAPVCSAPAATAASLADAASASVKVRSGARKRSAKASDFLPSPTCGPV
jgi:hypothetical protein